jgi:hypothetical protein
MDDTDPTDAPARRPRLPDASLPRADGGDAVPLRLPRTGTVLVLPGPAPDAAARAWLAALADAGATLRASDGRALVLIPEAAAARDLPGGVAVLVDERGRVAAAAGVEAPALVITDQWGEVWHAQAVPPGGAWPDVAEVDRWLGYLAIRCGG